MRSLGLYLTPAALAAAAACAFAESDDVAFARALAQRGYADIAERVLRRTAESSTAAPDRRAASRLALAQLRRFDASRAARSRTAGAPANERTLRLLRDAEGSYRDLLREPATARTARIDLARLLVLHAQFARAVAPTEPAAPLLAEALQLVADAQPASTGEDETASLRLLEIEALHAQGAALPPSDRGRTAALTRALDEIEKFTWDYAGTLRCAWAFRWRGLVLAEMGRTREACESLRDAATSVSERDGVRGADEMAFSSYDDLSRIASGARGADADAIVGDAVAAVERLEADWPRHVETASGRRARLAVAGLHARAGDVQRAVLDARAVLVAAGDADRDAADAACALLADWGPVAASGLDPETLATIARATARGTDVARTVNACRALISACTTAEARDRWAWDAWDTMGRAYGAAGRWFEAYLAFERIERAWRADPANARLAELTDTTAFYRADALSRLAAETRDGADSTAAERAMSEFARDHPGSSFASGAREQRAFRALAEAASLRRAGDRDAATVRAREALAALTAIGEESAMYDRAQALVAEAHRLLGETDDAIRLADAWLAAKRPDPVSAGARRSREQGYVQALITLLTATADRASATRDADARVTAFRDLLDALGRREADLVARAPRARDQIASWRAEALIATGDVDGAESLVLAQMKSHPASPGTRYLASEVARADDAAAEAARGTSAAKDLSLRAARLWEYVLESSDAPDPEVARSAGKAFRAGGDLAHAADLLSLAAGLHRGAAERSRDPAERRKLLDSARALSVELTQTLVALGRFDEAEAEAAALVIQSDDAGPAVLDRLARGETLRDSDVRWLVERAAKNRRAMDALACVYAGRGTRESFAAAARTIAALRYTLPRDAAATAETVDLALRHADAMIRAAASGGPEDAFASAGLVLDEVFGSDEALAEAETLVPGARERVTELRARVAAGTRKR